MKEETFSAVELFFFISFFQTLMGVSRKVPEQTVVLIAAFDIAMETNRTSSLDTKISSVWLQDPQLFAGGC